MPLAVVLWTGGISFGGVIAFIFADLLILPILNIYRKYYGWPMTLRIVAVFYVAMVAAGYVVEILFGLTGLAPDPSSAHLPDDGHPLELHHLAQHRRARSSPRRWYGASSAPAVPRC